ncbi:MAG: hypothetical protein JWO25_2937 [Alphaproteobacteria bacterium]|nr:hypothetical protein [Alphaproteobacteria bacterium]MDB5721666.1 hypothetical protein [Alphaproteobacteria bacterium]
MADETPAQAAHAAAVRRRWITLGEILAVVAVLISGLTLWNSYKERSANEAERSEARQHAAVQSQRVVLKASGGHKRLVLSALDPAQAIQSQTILFPSALGVAAIGDVIEPRIEADWIKEPAKKAREAAGDKPEGEGDLRLPVAITTRFVSGGETFTDAAVYDVGYRRDRGLLGGSDVALLGLGLVERVPAGSAQKRLDALWKSRAKPAAAADKKK